ncbi:MAG TPA: hypothetical protein VFV68_08930 [Agriterribacter sp.]|nr:hypothetical protein [Agriterribacter sp.]
MKRIALPILALILSITGLSAQETNEATPKNESVDFQKRPGRHGMGHSKGNMDFKELNLSPDQQSQIKKINENFKNKMSELKKNEATITVKDYKTQKQAFAKQRHEQMQKVFTPEQKEQLAKKREEERKRMDTTAKNRMEKMKTELQLTDDQSAKIKTLQADTRSTIKGIRENQSLTDDQKKEQVMATFKKQHEALNSLLTPEQMKKMENFRPARMHGGSK